MGSKILFNTVFINLEQVAHSGSFFAVYIEGWIQRDLVGVGVHWFKKFFG